MEDLKKGINEKGLIDFVKTCLLSGSDPRGKEAVKNLQWGIKQYRKHLILHGVIQRFLNSEIKIKVDDPTKKHLLKHIFIECGLNFEENKYTFEKGRFFWVESGQFNSGLKHLHNSMDLLKRNRNKQTLNLSDLNVV